MNFLRFALVSMTLLNLVACGSNDEGSKKDARQIVYCTDGKFVPEASNGIIGGDYINQSSWVAKTAVFLAMEVYIQEHKKYEWTSCTGVLVDQDIVLTAAHCVDGSRETRIQFTTQPTCNNRGGVITSDGNYAVQTVVHPKWGSSKNKFAERGDLAMVRMNAKAPSDYRPTSLSSVYLDPRQNPLLAAGYGKTSSTFHEGTLLRGVFLNGLTSATEMRATAAEKRFYQSLYQKYSASMDQEDMAEYNEIMSKQSLFSMNSSSEILYSEQTTGKGVCFGDSGGAAFGKRGDKYFVVGIASFVTNPESDSESCGMIGAHTSTLFYKTWLESTYKILQSASSSASKKPALFQ